MPRRPPPLPVLLERFPYCQFWLEGGIYFREAVLLHELGLHGLEDLKGWTKERFLNQPRLGPITLSRIEKLLGQELPSLYPQNEVDLERAQHNPLRAAQWRSLGFGTNTAAALAARDLSIRDLKNLKREDFEAIRGVGPHSVSLCQRLFGIWPNEEPEAVREPVPDEEPR